MYTSIISISIHRAIKCFLQNGSHFLLKWVWSRSTQRLRGVISWNLWGKMTPVSFNIFYSQMLIWKLENGKRYCELNLVCHFCQNVIQVPDFQHSKVLMNCFAHNVTYSLQLHYQNIWYQNIKVFMNIYMEKTRKIRCKCISQKHSNIHLHVII